MFRIFKAWRERRRLAKELAYQRELEERRQEREHQLALLKAIGQMNLDATTNMVEGLTRVAQEMAASSKAQSEILTTWLKSFQTQTAPYSSTFGEEEEMEAERKRALEEIQQKNPNFPTNLPYELQLAYELLRSEDPTS